MRRHVVSIALVTLAGCDRDDPKPTCKLHAAPSGAVVLGDANGDGFVDVSDAVYLQRHTFHAGAEPACDRLVDILTDYSIDAGDSYPLLSYLFPGVTTTLETDGTDCDTYGWVEPDVCGDGLSVGILAAQGRVTGAGTATFTVDVGLTSPSFAPDAWSVAVEATGCTIESATTDGTETADIHADPPGKRNGGYAWTSALPATSVGTAAILDWHTDATLTASEGPHSVLTLTVSAPVGTSCGSCTLAVVEQVPGVNVPVETVVSAGGYRLAPALGSTTVEVCPE